MSKLLPCPFCGVNAEMRREGEFCQVICGDCGSRAAEYPNDILAALAWNTRAAHPPHTEESRIVTHADREYASELLADLTNDDLPRLEITARWFRKARVENALRAEGTRSAVGSPQQSVDK